jgi:competence protein ComEC
MRAPALSLAAAFIAGLAIASAATGNPLHPACAALAFLVAAAVLAWQEGYIPSFLVLAAYACLGFAAGELRERETTRSTLRDAYERIARDATGRPVHIAGRLRREAELEPDAALLTLDSETVSLHGQSFDARGGLRVRVSGELNARLRTLTARDRISFWGRLAEPSSFANDGGFDVRRHFERERLDLTASVKSALLVELQAKASPSRAWVSRLRMAATRRLEAALSRSPPDTLGVVVALVTGDRARLSPELETLYRRAGIFHVMAISGAQVALVIVALYFAARRLGASEVAALSGLLLVLPIYAAFCGSGPPVVRAALAASLVLSARLLSLDRPHGNALAIAAILLLAFEPLWLGDPGFQLSFAAMAAILWLSEPLSRRLAPLRFLAAPLSISFAAQAAVAPITAWHFHALTWVAPFASLAAVPLSGILVIAGLALAVLGDAPLLSEPLRFAATAGVSLLTGTASFAARLPGATLAIPRPSPLWIVGYYAALVGIRQGPRRTQGLGLLVLCALLLRLPFRTGRPVGEPESLTLVALDVGHGDALVLTLPGGGRVLVDGGGLAATSFDVGERVILPYLLDHGGRRLDAVVASHADYDHIGGLHAILESMNVREMWEGGSRWDRPAYRRLREAARRRELGLRRLVPGENFRHDGALFEVLAASGVPGGPAPTEENERSIVMRVSVGESSVLLTGDAGEEIERALLASGIPLEADVLKVGHHGSKNSTSRRFLEAVRPRFAILSARESSASPLPSPAVLERLRRSGIDYARTDRDGAITVRLDPAGGIRVSTRRARLSVSRRSPSPLAGTSREPAIARRARGPAPGSGAGIESWRERSAVRAEASAAAEPSREPRPHARSPPSGSTPPPEGRELRSDP